MISLYDEMRTEYCGIKCGVFCPDCSMLKSNKRIIEAAKTNELMSWFCPSSISVWFEGQG
jgi:hypothetical protein